MKRLDRKACRTINTQKAKITRLSVQVRKLQRNLNRMRSKQNAMTTSNASDSPATKATTLLRSGNMTKVRKELTFTYALQANFKKGAKRMKEKKSVASVVAGPILRKYRMLNKLKKDLRLYAKPQSRKKKKRLSVADKVTQFFLEDANSSPTSGKRETKTLKKEKKQRRYLCGTMLNLYAKFKAEHPREKISYTVFTRLRPFYVLPPSVDERDTVRCKLHHNMLAATGSEAFLNWDHLIKESHSSDVCLRMRFVKQKLYVP